MTDTPDFVATRELIRSLGPVELEAVSTPKAFGSWFITAAAKERRIRVRWDGRDVALIIQAPSLSGRSDDWGDRWLAGPKYSHKPDQLMHGLLSVLGD